MKISGIRVALIAACVLLSSTASSAQGQRNSSYGRNTIMYTGTEVDWKGEVTNRNYQFLLPPSGQLTIHVNLVRTVDVGGLGLGSARVKVTLRDSRSNDIAVISDVKSNDLNPSNRILSFFFTANQPGIYYVEVLDGYDFRVNATSVIVGRR